MSLPLCRMVAQMVTLSYGDRGSGLMRKKPIWPTAAGPQ